MAMVSTHTMKPDSESAHQPTDSSLDPNVRAIVERVVILTNPDKIILFGSRAGSQHDPQSDLDLLIVVPDPVGDTRQRENELRRLFPGSSLAVDPWIMGRLEFEETKNVVGGLAYPATHEGVLVYEKS